MTTESATDDLIEQLEERRDAVYDEVAQRVIWERNSLCSKAAAALRSKDARIAELEEHKRKQAQDIKVLGALVYDESDPPVSWLSRAEAAEAERDHWRAQVKQVLDPSYLNEKLEQIGVYSERDQLLARIAELERERDGAVERGLKMLDAKNHWADRARMAEASVERLRGALEPFSDCVDYINPHVDDGHVVLNLVAEELPLKAKTLTAGDFRAARSFYKETDNADH